MTAFLPVENLGDSPYGVYGPELKRLMPPGPVPKEFRSQANPWAKVVSQWFFNGLPVGTTFVTKPGIKGLDVFRHVGAILRSYELKHEDKEATCAYLLSLWLERVDPPSLSAQPTPTKEAGDPLSFDTSVQMNATPEKEPFRGGGGEFGGGGASGGWDAPTDAPDAAVDLPDLPPDP